MVFFLLPYEAARVVARCVRVLSPLWLLPYTTVRETAFCGGKMVESQEKFGHTRMFCLLLELEVCESSKATEQRDYNCRPQGGVHRPLNIN